MAQSNLPTFIALEKLLQGLQHGTMDLQLQVRSAEIVGVTATGHKKTLYNASEKDENTNQVALEYIVKRIAQQLQANTSGEIVFRVQTQNEKIKSVVVESKQTIR